MEPDNDADVEEKVEKDFHDDRSSPFDYRYMKFIRVILRIISGWPGKELGEKRFILEGNGYNFYNTILSFIYFVLGVWYLKDHIKNLSFMELGHMYIVLLMNLLSSSRCVTLCISKKYPVVAYQFVKEIHLVHHKHKSKYAKSVFKKVHSISNFLTVYLFAITIIALFLFNLTPVYNNYVNGKYESTKGLVNTTYEHAIYFKFPFNAYTNFTGYIIASIINWYGSYLCASSVTMFDLFLALMVFNLWGHFKILLNILETFPKPASANTKPGVNFIKGSEQYSESEQAEIADKLKECVVYHRVIADFTQKMSDAFGMCLFIYFTFHQISGCLMLLECSQLNPQALIRYLPLTIMMFQQLIQVSVIFESIGSMSDKVKHAVYATPWECMNSKNRNTMLIFLINTQEPIHVTAGGMVPVGVTTMASILKTSISYFAFLRTVGSE